MSVGFMDQGLQQPGSLTSKFQEHCSSFIRPSPGWPAQGIVLDPPSAHEGTSIFAKVYNKPFVAFTSDDGTLVLSLGSVMVADSGFPAVAATQHIPPSPETLGEVQGPPMICPALATPA